MKLSWCFLIFIFLNSAFGQVELGLISEVKLNCDFQETCQLLQPKFAGLKGKEYDFSSLKFELKSRLFEQSIGTFDFKVLKEDGKNILDITLTTRKTIDTIIITSPLKGISLDGLILLMPIQEGDYYNSDLVAQIPAAISKYLFDIGVTDAIVELNIKPRNSEVNIEINIPTAKIMRIRKIRWFHKEGRNIDLIKNKILKLGGRVYDRKEINLMIEQISKEIWDAGFPFSYLKLRQDLVSQGITDITLDFDLALGEKTNFDITGNSLLTRNSILAQVKNKLKDQSNLKFEQIKDIITSEIIELYEEIGFYNTAVKISVIEGFDVHGEKMKTYFIKVEEGTKIKVADISFIGNRFFNDDYLKKVYYQNSTSLAGNKYLDKAYLEKFRQIAFEEYLKNGYINAEIGNPKIEYVEKSKTALISFRIKENRAAIFGDINFSREVSELFKEDIKKVISNQVGSPLNVIMLDSDVEQVEKFLKKQGYLFTKIKNKESENIISYNPNLSSAELFLDIELGKKAFFNNLYISGNIKTKEEVLTRESTFERGELLTWEKLNNFMDRISSTGLFKEVKVFPRPVESIPYGAGSQLVDLVIEVAERDFTALEIGPGFRTDLGARLATKFRLLNVSGMGRRLSFRGELNQRLSENAALSPARQGLYPLAFLEYYVDAKFEEPYLAGYSIGMDITGSIGRRRYRNFDSDIFLSSIILSENTSWLSPLLRYQFENDYQYNAIYEKDEGIFKIGSLAPSLSFDFRDRRVNPTKGFFLSLIGEYAGPELGSISTNNYKINFFSLISRNNFYYPFSYNWVGAMYLSAGYQKNLATDLLVGSSGDPVLDDEGIPTTIGYIPTIKVFRLEGGDNVRGYRNAEINTLSNGKDIADVVVDDTAYYLNIKLEGRHYINDNFVVFPFFDAGSIQVDSWVPFELKTSVGIGFKYLTPMGSMELDFGVKTHRATVNGNKETFGAVELMIGYF